MVGLGHALPVRGPTNGKNGERVLRLTKISLANRTVVLLLSVLVIGMGLYSTTALKQELIPSIDVPRGNVVSVYQGASPDVVEAQVSKPVEAAVKAVDGVTSVTSVSSSGVSQVTVQWNYGIGADDMANKLRSAIDSISGGLPGNVDPTVITGGTDDIPVVVLALSSDEDLNTLSQKVTETVATDLKSVPGVRDVSVSGKEEHEIVITYKQAKLQEYGVDPNTIAQLFAANASAIPSGTLRTGTANLDVQTGTTYSSAEEIAKLRVQGTDGPLLLSDLATVKERPVAITSISRVDGRASLVLTVTKTPESNTVTVAHGVNELLPGLERTLGSNAKFVTVFDQAPYIEQSVHDLTVEGGIGLAMAVFVILLFLRSVRPTIITAISIPLSLLIALIALWLGGYTLNILTLAALTVAIGRVVDDSIVVIENIKRHQSYGEFGSASITNAVKEVAGAVTSSTLTTVAVFLPIGLVGGQAGQIFRPFAVAAVVALLGSLVVSLTVVPVFASWFMRPTAKQQAVLAASGGHEKDTWLQKGYLPVLNWTLAHRWLTLLMAVLVFGGTLALVPRLKTDFIGSMGSESLALSQKLPSGTGLSETDKAATKIEGLLAQEPSVLTYSTTIGSGSSAVFLAARADSNEARFTVPLKAGADATETADRLRQQIAELGPDVGEVEVSIGAGNAGSGVVVYVESTDSEQLKAGNAQVLQMMQGIPGLTNLTSDLSVARDQLSVNVNERKAADQGMTQASIGQAVARSVRGQLIGTLAQGDTTLNVYLRSQTPVKDIDELRAIKLPVTQLMNANAKSDAADKVQKRADKVSADSKRQQTKAYNDQVAALKKSRSQAVKAQKTLNKQLSSAKKKLASLQRQLSAAGTACVPPAAPIPPTVPTTPSRACLPVPLGVFQLSQQLSATGSQVAGLSSALAQAKSGVTQADKQLDALAEQRSKSQEAQATQESLSQAGKDAGKATADPVRLSDVASVKLVQAPSSITRVNGIRAATISASSESSDLGATTTQITQGLAGLELPSGVTVRIGGVSQQQQESFAQLGLAMLVAVAVVYLIMVATFGSLLQPLLLLVSIPFAATGALGLSLLTDTPLGIASMIGLLMLIVIVVTNAIVLIDLINQKRKAGAGVDESIQQGARLRVRPIVMTALATIFALVPMGLGLTGGGVFISKPLAIVVIGGLVSSTLLTLILGPVLYDLLETWRQNRRDRKAQRQTKAEEEASAPAGAEA